MTLTAKKRCRNTAHQTTVFEFGIKDTFCVNDGMKSAECDTGISAVTFTAAKTVQVNRPCTYSGHKENAVCDLDVEYLKRPLSQSTLPPF